MNARPTMVAATEFWDGTTGAGLVKGFRELGWLVQQVDQGEFVRSPRTLAHRVASRLTRDATASAYREAVWRECCALRPRVFFTVKGTGLTAELLRNIRGLGTKTLMYYPDVNFDHAGVHPDSFPYYDLFVTTKSFQVQWLQERLGPERVSYIPHGYTDDLFQPIADEVQESQYAFDVLYAGNHSPYKQQWLERLLVLSPELKLGVVGNRWREQRVPLRLAASSLLGEVRGLSLAKLIQLSKVNIGLHFGMTRSGWADLVSRRTFEIPACKGFMLHIDNGEIRDTFDVGTEIDVFSSPEDLSRKIRFYLDRPELRAQMVERAFRRAVPAYGHARRAAQIHELLRAASWLESAHA